MHTIGGAIIYFVKREQEPASAKTACYAALAGLALGIIVQVIYTMMMAKGM